MAFSSLPSSLYAVGKAVTRQLFNTLKGNQDDLQSRLLTVEASTNKVVFFDGTIAGASKYTTLTGAVFHRVQSDITITDAKVILFDKGAVSSGTLSVDVQTSSSPDFTSSLSVFTTEPSLDLSVASSYSESTNAVLDASNKILSEGDYLRIDISSLPSGLNYLGIYLIGEPT
jgi:hypothetical protein